MNDAILYAINERARMTPTDGMRYGESPVYNAFLDREQLLKAMNSHKQLVEALRELLTAAEGLADQQAMSDDTHYPAIAGARALLARLANGE